MSQDVGQPGTRPLPVENNAAPPFKRRRAPKAALACQLCRVRKTRCNSAVPRCSQCARYGDDCVYEQRNVRRRQTTDSHSLGNFGERNHLADAGNSQSTFSDPNEAEDMRHIKGKSPCQQPIPTPESLQELHTQCSNATNIAQPSNERLSSDDYVASGNLSSQNFDAMQDGVNELNTHTSGLEFFGPSGTFPFLRRLWIHSRTSRTHVGPLSPIQIQQQISAQTPRDGSLSVVNFLHNEDYPATTRPPTPEQYPSFTRPQSPAPRHSTKSRGPDQKRMYIRIQVEKECIRLYFENLHLVYPILRRSSFLSRCERDVWSMKDRRLETPNGVSGRSKFLALYNAVCALGAITAGEETRFATPPHDSRQKSDETRMAPDKPVKPFTPREVAKCCFESAKRILGSAFEICSLESTQAWFLMSVFCHHALKPHSCYIYSGIAARTALAIGMVNVDFGNTTEEKQQASWLWWCIYTHEMETCCASGRDSLLKAPEHYSIYPPERYINSESDTSILLISSMVALAEILRVASKQLYVSAAPLTFVEKSALAMKLDGRLRTWKHNLPPLLNVDRASLRDPTWLTKQKLVIQLRYLSAKSFLHRQFLTACLSNQSSYADSSTHVDNCIGASQELIQLLYNTYLYQPYFRTWWYNTTYILNASMNILYVMLLGIQTKSTESLISDVQKSLEVLQAMDSIQVARNCEQLISEVLEVVKARISNHLSASSYNQDRPLQTIPDRSASDLSLNFRPESAHHDNASAIESIDCWSERTKDQRQDEMHNLSCFNSTLGGAFFAELIDSSLLGNISRLGESNIGPGYLTASSPTHHNDYINRSGGLSSDRNLDFIMGEENGVLVYSMTTPSAADQGFDFLDGFNIDGI
ncbi:hypothetical protein B0O99DRAFT_749021 [Bisporella sp. PMI_857]|nr:hypothetical protein B0O99DRAFT_749021 [Bisporella sp. PMI_857]